MFNQNSSIPAPMQSTRFANLRQKAEQPQPIHWKPCEQEAVLGIIVKRDKITTQYGQQDILILQREDGVLISVFLTKYLQTGLEKQQAEVGSLVSIKYLGLLTSKYGKQYNGYELIVDNG